MTYTTAGADHRAKDGHDDLYVGSGFSRTCEASSLVRLKADPTYRMFDRALRVSAVVALCVMLPRTVAAQASRTWDVFGGYAYLRDQNEEVSLPVGWAAGASTHLNRWLSVVVDAGGNYKTLPLVGGDAKLTAHTLMAGGRASLAIGRFVEFAQILAGPAYTHGTAFGLASSDRFVAVQAGLGLDMMLKRHLAGRFELDVRRLRTGREVRAIAGLVYVR